MIALNLKKAVAFLTSIAATAILPVAQGHGTEVRICRTPTGETRFFVQHWHADTEVTTATAAGTMTIRYQDQVAGTTTDSLQYPHGIINGKTISTSPTGWGCISDATPTLVGRSCYRGTEINWVYFDYSTTCNRPVQYTLLAGTTVVLQDAACTAGNVYPAATGWFSASDASPPVPKINGNALPWSPIVVTASNVGDTSAVVTFAATADDDCDSNPSLALSHASGSSFPIGNTNITVTATDASGRSTSGVLRITVIAKTAAPTTSPTKKPTMSPTRSPTQKPTTMAPTKKPTSPPTKAPSKNPTKAPTKKPTSPPTKVPSKNPTQAPTKKPTSPPTKAPSKNPTKAPTKKPTSKPTSPPTKSPSSQPSTSFQPSSQPSIVIETVTIVGMLSTNQDFCSMGGAKLAAFKDASIKTIRGLTCPDPNDDSCSAEITSACGAASRRQLSSHRLLQSATSWQLEYEVVNTFTCQTASCSSPADLAAAVSISNSVSTTMENSMSSGSFLTLLSTALVQTSAFDASIAMCLVVWGNTETQPQTAVGGGGGTGKFYPDWENDSGTCLEDGNEPLYMANDETMWLSDSLVECCLRFYQWDTNSCLNIEGSGLWYADQLNGKCVTDCKEGNGETCGGLANVFSDRIYSDPMSCCESELQWMFPEFCEAESFVSSCYAGTGLYYRGDSAGSEVCVRDCDPASGDRTCGGLVEERWVVLHDTAEDCCTLEYSWIDTELCAARTTHALHGKYWADKSGICYQDSVVPTEDLSVELYDSIEDCCAFGVPWLSEGACLAASGIDMTVSGSNLFYVQNDKCAQDCEGAAPCGGLAEKWDTMYDTEAKCCAKIPWIARRECVLA